MNQIAVFIIFVLLIFSFGCQDSDKISEGDFIFQETISNQSKALTIVTKSRYTHVGLVFDIDGDWFIFEAVDPVKITPLAEFISRGKNSHYVIKRLVNSRSILTGMNINKLKAAGQSWLEKPYDIYFNWSDDRIYCTELLYKLFSRTLNFEIAKLEHLGDFDLEDPFVRKMLFQRFGNTIPINEPVLSVSGLFNSDKLFTVSTVN